MTMVERRVPVLIEVNLKACVFGRWRNRTDSPYGLIWTPSCLKIVGYYFENENTASKFCDAVLGKFESVLSKWSSTMYGKVTMLNSLAVPTSCGTYLKSTHQPVSWLIASLSKSGIFSSLKNLN